MAGLSRFGPLLRLLRLGVTVAALLFLCWRLGAQYDRPGELATPGRYREQQQVQAARREAAALASDWQVLYDHLAEPEASALVRLADARRIMGRWHSCSAYTEAACRALVLAAEAVAGTPDPEAARAVAEPYLGTAALYLEALAGLP